MLRYSEETINVLVRDALNFEKKKKFEEAIEIYEELSLQGVEFAIDRIPITRHRLDSYKLRRIELFTNIVSACVIGISVVSISYNTAFNLISHNDINSYFAFSETKSQISSPLKPEIKYHSINESPVKTQSEFEIFIPNDIDRKKLSNRITEAINLYYQQVPFDEKKLKINIKTSQNGSTWIGYADFDLKSKSKCDVYILKGIL